MTIFQFWFSSPLFRHFHLSFSFHSKLQLIILPLDCQAVNSSSAPNSYLIIEEEEKFYSELWFCFSKFRSHPHFAQVSVHLTHASCMCQTSSFLRFEGTLSPGDFDIRTWFCWNICINMHILGFSYVLPLFGRNFPNILTCISPELIQVCLF